MTRIALVMMALLATTLVAQPPIVTTVLSNGTTDTRYDMVILGDGYQPFEQGQFDADVTAFLATLFQTQPYQTFAAYYNVHTVFRASVDSGADHPDATPPIYRNTVYDASYNTGGTPRCLYIHNSSQALADAALAPANEGRVLVMVNDSRYGGCAGTFAVSYNGGSMSQVQIHELGHSLGQLADEYDYPNTTYTGPEPSEVNATTSPTGQKWSHWHGSNGISAFEGARYHEYGIYRPRSNCLMRTLFNPLCAVCQENIARITNSICNVIDQVTPANTTVAVNVGTIQPFSFSHYVPLISNPAIEWQLDGTVIAGANATSYLLDTTGVALGYHTVTCTVEDQTPIVRLDPAHVMHHSHTWNLTVTDPTAAEIRMLTASVSPVWTTPGSNLTVNYSVINDGPATATFDVEFFLSDSNTWSVNDTYLGKQTVTNLAATQQLNQQHQVVLPWRLEAGVGWVHVVADRTNAVPELSETNNERYTVFIGQAGPCFTKIEYADPLLYPHDAASVSTGAGGTVHPTIVAPCATPGTLYLIAWGCSGTAPGTTLAPGVTVPINQDFHTQLGLSLVNGAMFQAYLGTLDAQGRGHATFDLPPGSALWPSTGHFAAVLIDPSPMFAGATNPVSITITP